MQRALDLLISGTALCALAPIMLPVALILRFSGEGEVFYRQARVGRGGVEFGLLKFATMLKDSPNMGTGTITLQNDPRVLPVGRVLRATKINELPQLLNILRGDMSLVGPRPQTRRCFDAFPGESAAAILQVPPGLSGIGSIVFRDEERLMHEQAEPEMFYDKVIMPYKGRLEQWYVANRSMAVYFKCLVITVIAVVHPGSKLVWSAFENLPPPPIELADLA